MVLLNKQNFKTGEKGCKNYFCKKSCSSSSSSSSSSSDCFSDSNESFNKLNSSKGKFKNINGTTFTSESVDMNSLKITNDIKNNLPTFISTNSFINIPTYYTDLSLLYVITTDANISITFGKLNSSFNGVRLVFANGTGSPFVNTITFTVTSPDTISPNGTITTLAARSSVEYIGLWNNSTNIMTFYKIR